MPPAEADNDPMNSVREAHAGICGCPWADGWQAYLRSPNDTTHPYAVPGASLRLAQLPPTLIIVGHVDAMRDEGLKFAARLKGAGVDVETLELMNHADNTGPPATVAPVRAARWPRPSGPHRRRPPAPATPSQAGDARRRSWEPETRN